MSYRTITLMTGFIAMMAMGAFEAPPAAAVSELGAIKGKRIRDGLVVLDGRVIAPPYVVMRYGNVLKINDKQVSAQLIPWSVFQGIPAAPAPRSSVSSSKPKIKPAASQSIDDLFDDDEPAPPPPPPKPVVEESKAPAVAVPLSAGKRSQYVNQMNATRKEVDSRLRKGGIIFFGSRYARLAIDVQMSDKLLAILPNLIINSEDGADLLKRLKANGFSFFNEALCDDLVRNRTAYGDFVEANKRFKEAAATRKIFQNGQQRALR